MSTIESRAALAPEWRPLCDRLALALAESDRASLPTFSGGEKAALGLVVRELVRRRLVTVDLRGRVHRSPAYSVARLYDAARAVLPLTGPDPPAA